MFRSVSDSSTRNSGDRSRSNSLLTSMRRGLRAVMMGSLMMVVVVVVMKVMMMMMAMVVLLGWGA